MKVENCITTSPEQDSLSAYRSTKTLIEKFKAKFLITPANIPEFVLPIVEFINDAKPDYIIANDRGGRLVAFAAHILHQELYGELSTRDHLIRLGGCLMALLCRQCKSF